MKDSRVFLDTNIMVYAYSGTELDKQSVSRKLLAENNTTISTQVLQELANTLARKFGVDYITVQNTLKECIQNNNNVFVNNPTTILKACQIAERYGYSFYDSTIVAAAIESGCSVLYSEDLQHHQKIEKLLTIVNPFK